MEEPSSAAASERSGKDPLILLAGLAALGEFAATAYLPAITVIAAGLGTGVDTIQATVTTGLVTFALGGPLIGSVADRMGRRQLLLPALALYLIGCGLAALAPSVPWLFAGRVFQALGAGAGLIVSRAIARDLRSGPQLAKLLAAVTLAFSLAPAAAPLIGGLLEQSLGWRAIFAFAFIYGSIVLLAVLRMPETNTRRNAQMKPGQILAGFADILTQRSFILPTLVAAALLAALFAFLVGAAPIFVGLLKLSPAVVGAFPTLTMVGLILGTIGARSLSGRMPQHRLVLLGAVIAVLGAIVMTQVPISAPHILGAMILFNIGLGLVLPVVTAMAMSDFGDRAGAASSMIGFVQLLGGAAGSLIVPSIGMPVEQAVPIAMVACAGIAVLTSALLKPSCTAETVHDAT